MKIFSILTLIIFISCGSESATTVQDTMTTTEAQDSTTSTPEDTTTTTVPETTTATVQDTTTESQDTTTNEVPEIDYFNLSFQIDLKTRNVNCKIKEYVRSVNIPVKQFLEEIGWDTPKNFENAEICFLFSDGISDEFIKQHNEFHNILFDYLGAYDRYIHYVYSRDEDENTDALEILNKLGCLWKHNKYC